LRGETEERWRQLCERAVIEQDPERFVSLIQELLQELEDEEQERRHNSAELGLPPTESRKLDCPSDLRSYVGRTVCFRRALPVWFVRRRKVVSDTPFQSERIEATPPMAIFLSASLLFMFMPNPLAIAGGYRYRALFGAFWSSRWAISVVFAEVGPSEAFCGVVYLAGESDVVPAVRARRGTREGGREGVRCADVRRPGARPEAVRGPRHRWRLEP
jgi:hypothetical protein